MPYIEGFVASVGADKRDAYVTHCREAAPLFKRLGAGRVVDCLEDDVADGKVTDFRRAVAAQSGELVAFSWIEYPDRATRDAASEKMNSDPDFVAMGESMPFDGKRLIFGGFAPFVDESGPGNGGYVDGFVLPVPEAKRDAYRELASKAAKVFVEYGASRVVEAWADDVPHGKVTDFWRSVKAEPGEQVVFSYIEWPSRQARDEAWKKVMADERMQPDMANMPFDGQRMFWGGFERINVG